jgi:sensor c-di-GMP phosphodiesterase-like protein
MDARTAASQAGPAEVKLKKSGADRAVRGKNGKPPGPGSRSTQHIPKIYRTHLDRAAVIIMSIMSVASQHNVFSSYGAVHMQRQLIPSAALHAEELSAAAQQAAAALATKDGLHEAQSVAATSTENKAHQFDRRTTNDNSFASGAGNAGSSSTLESDGPAEAAPEPSRAELPQLGATLDVYL